MTTSHMKAVGDNMKVINVMKDFIENMDSFLKHNKHDDCEDGLYIMIGDNYFLVDMDNSYWYLEDDGTVVFRVNDEW